MPLPVGTVPAIVTGIGSLLGGSSARSAARQEARKQRDFQKMMSDTAHQREIKDLKLAGLNPILSGMGGRGASTPAGAKADIQDIITPALSSAMQVKSAFAQIEQLDASSRNLNASAAMTEAQTPKQGFFGSIWSQIKKNLDTTIEGIHSAKSIDARKKRGQARQVGPDYAISVNTSNSEYDKRVRAAKKRADEYRRKAYAR